MKFLHFRHNISGQTHAIISVKMPIFYEHSETREYTFTKGNSSPERGSPGFL